MTSKVTHYILIHFHFYPHTLNPKENLYIHLFLKERRIFKEAKTQRKYFPLSPRAGSILKGFQSATSTLNLYLNPQNTHWKYIHKCTAKSHSNLFSKNHKTPSHEPLKETPKNLPLHTPKYPEKSLLFTCLKLQTACLNSCNSKSPTL